jgi:hypothetical protein
VCYRWDAKIKKNINILRVRVFALIAGRKKQSRARHSALSARCRIGTTKRSMSQRR